MADKKIRSPAVRSKLRVYDIWAGLADGSGEPTMSAMVARTKLLLPGNMSSSSTT